MDAEKNYITKINGEVYSCDIYLDGNKNFRLFVDGQPVDELVHYMCEVGAGLLVITEDDCGEKWHWILEQN